MIGLDTNVLVRYLTQDDPRQAERANRLIDRQLTEEEPGFISLVAMVETVWVLDRVHRFSSAEITMAIERLLQVKELVVEREEHIFIAMMALKQGRGSFADALIGSLGRVAGCRHTVTFDQKALRLPDFQAV